MRTAALLPCLALVGCARAVGAPQPPGEGPPQRIVSMNPCVDAVLRDIAAPGQIASVSAYSQDPRATSVPLEWARRYPANNGSAEDVIAMRPDLVIAGPHVAVQTIAALKRQGVALMQVAVPESIAENRVEIAAIGARIGRPAAAGALNRRIDEALARSRWPGRPATALIWQGSGLVAGKGTLADELLTHTGFHNISPELGLGKWDILPLEGLFLNPPQVLLAGRADMGAGSGDANRMLSHPALRKAGRAFRIADYPSGLLHCGGPVILRSLDRLAAVRRELGAAQ